MQVAPPLETKNPKRRKTVNATFGRPSLKTLSKKDRQVNQEKMVIKGDLNSKAVGSSRKRINHSYINRVGAQKALGRETKRDNFSYKVHGRKKDSFKVGCDGSVRRHSY